MLGYKYTTEENLILEQERLKELLGLNKEQVSTFISIFEHIDGCWYIVYSELIAPYMPPPTEYVFNIPANEIIPNTEENADTTDVLP